MLLERFGPIVINITRVINDIFTVIFTYVVLMVAFSLGLVFILDGSFNFDLVSLLLALEATEPESEPVTQMALELINNHLISVQQKR